MRRLDSHDPCLLVSPTILPTQALKESNAIEHTIEKQRQNAGEESGANGATSSVLDIFREAREAIPEEEYEKLPADGLEQIDHYVYGVPQR